MSKALAILSRIAILRFAVIGALGMPITSLLPATATEVPNPFILR